MGEELTVEPLPQRGFKSIAPTDNSKKSRVPAGCFALSDNLRPAVDAT